MDACRRRSQSRRSPPRCGYEEDNVYDGMTDEELADIIAYIQRALEEEGDSGPDSAAQ
jgi:hypothetical protein